MAEKIFIADKPTLDLVKSQVDLIKGDTEEILSNFGSARIYTPDITRLKSNNNTNNVLYKFLNISGKGILKSFTFSPNSTTNGTVILIDGVNLLTGDGDTKRGFSNADYTGQTIWFDLPFHESLVITSGNNGSIATVQYVLT